MKKILLSLAVMGAMSAHAVSFQSPSGNITCVGDTKHTQGVECYIHTLSTSTIKPPKDCPLDFGQTFFVGRSGEAEVVCHGDVPDSAIADNPKSLAYGQSIKGDGWTCSSAKAGMTCKNHGKHGFVLSKHKQSVF